MTPELLLPIALLFVSIALVTGLGASAILARTAPERRRLREMTLATAGGQVSMSTRPGLIERPDPRLERLARTLPKSPKEMGRLRRRLATAGINSFRAAVIYSVAEVVLPMLFGASPFSFMSGPLEVDRHSAWPWRWVT